MKPSHLIDFLFIGICIVFGALSLYEIGKTLAPLYSYSRLFIMFIISLGAYLAYKYRITFGDIQSFLHTIHSDHEALEHTHQKRQGDFFACALWAKKHKNEIVYYSFFALFFSLCISVFFNFSGLLLYTTGLFALVYIIAKILGFRITYYSEKSSILQGNTWRFFLIIFAIFVTLSSVMLREFGLEGTEKQNILFFAAGIYFLLGVILFFKIPVSIPKMSWYNIMSLLLIVILGGVLVYKNLPEVETPAIVDISEENVIMQDPLIIEAIVSDEAQVPQSRSVSQVYEINAPLGVGNSGGDVINLQLVLKEFASYTGAIDGVYSEQVRLALRDTLIAECNWPQTTQGIFGPLAKECIDNLEILAPVNN